MRGFFFYPFFVFLSFVYTAVVFCKYKKEVFIKRSMLSPCIFKTQYGTNKTNEPINNIDILHSDSKIKERGKEKWKFKYTVCSNDDEISSCCFMLVNISSFVFRLDVVLMNIFYHTLLDESDENDFIL